MSAPLIETSYWIPISVLIAGLIGSPHCASMCGPLVMNFAVKRKRLFYYQMGRMISYSTAGALAGAFGEAVLGSTRPPWLTQLSLAFIALTLIVSGYRTFSGGSLHFPWPQLPKPLWMRGFSMKLWSITRRPSMPAEMTATLTGLLTVFLPCGHLLSFLVGAVATGTAINGALFMFAFWLGSSPLLMLTGIWMPTLMKLRQQRGRRWAGAILVVAGLMSLAAFGFRPEPPPAQAHGHDHEHLVQPGVPRCH